MRVEGNALSEPEPKVTVTHGMDTVLTTHDLRGMVQKSDLIKIVDRNYNVMDVSANNITISPSFIGQDYALQGLLHVPNSMTTAEVRIECALK